MDSIGFLAAVVSLWNRSVLLVLLSTDAYEDIVDNSMLPKFMATVGTNHIRV